LSDNEIVQTDNKNNEDYKVKIDNFEGPLDLLLHLTKTSEIDIYNIPIAEITKQYLIYLSFLVYLDLENITEFVDMASILLLIKSKALLPNELEYEEDEEDPRLDLISTLLEYQKFKIAAGLLESKSEESIPLIKKSNEQVLFDLKSEGQDENWKQLSVLDLIGAFVEVLNKNNESDIGLEILLYDYSVDDKIIYIKDMLKEKDSFNFFEIIKDNMPKIELVCTFLAILELVKNRIISVRQHLIFGDIHIIKR
jgi:segregation and condensation protein A